MPPPHPCPASWPLKRLEDSHRVTRFGSREGSGEVGRERDPLLETPGVIWGSRAPAPKVLPDCRTLGAAPPKFSAFLSVSLSFSLSFCLSVSLPPPSPDVLLSALPFLPHLPPPLTPLPTLFPLLAMPLGSTSMDPVPDPELGVGEGERDPASACFPSLVPSL